MDNIGEGQNQRQKQEKGNTVLLTVIGVATLLVALVGATFAYFTATVTNNNNQSVTITTATGGGLTYNTTDQIALSNAVPSASDTGKFTVTNPSNSGANTLTYTYDLDLIVTVNEFVTTEGTGQLTFVITPSSTGSNRPTLVNYGTTTDITAIATGTYPVVSDQTIAVGETQTYDSVLTFVETNSEQNTNQGKAFAAHIDIKDVKSA